MVDANGIPLAIEHSGANVHDSEMAIALVDAIPPIKQPRGRPRPSLRLEPDSGLDQIASICEELRRRTWFNDSTGCINDHQPLIVPLLPPEEIWCDGRELPLDVWRLLSFDYDLVASAIASGGRIIPFSYAPATQTALAFAHLDE